MEVEIAMQYTDSFNENISTYANNIITSEGGMHLEGYKRAFDQDYKYLRKKI